MLSKFHVRLVLLILILSIASSMNILLVAHDNRPPQWDYATYLTSSLKIYNAIAHGSFAEFSLAVSDPYRPPLVPMSTLPFYAVFGTSYRSAMLVSLLFLAILIVSTYKLGEIVHSWQLGLLAAAVISTLPGVIHIASIFGVDFPLMALVAAGLYFTVASQGFRRRDMSIALGITIGLGMLTKWSYFVFVAPMILAELFQHRRDLRYANIILCGFVSLVISSTWYVNALNQGLVQYLTRSSWGTAVKPHAISSSMLDMPSLLFYPQKFYDLLLGPFYSLGLLTIAVLIIVFSALFLRGRFRCRLSPAPFQSIAFSFVVSLLIFTFLENKQARFLLPALPSLVIILIIIGWSKNVRLTRLLLVGVILVGSIVSVVGAFEPTIGTRLGIYNKEALVCDYYEFVPPKPHDWKVEQIIQLIASHNPEARIGILASHWVFNQDTFTYYALRLGYDDLAFTDFRNKQVFPPYDDLNYYDFILLKTCNVGSELQTQKVRKILEQLKNPEDSFYDNHKMIQSFDLPDDSQLYVFKAQRAETT